MIDKMNTEMKEESKNSKSAKGSNDTGLSIETLKQMGYNYPCTARRIIEDMQQGKDPKSIDSGLIRSLLTIEGHGHIFHSFVLSYTKIYPEENPSCKESKDYILLIDRRWVPSNNGRLLGKFVDAICDGKTVEEALECLKEEETKEAVKPEEGTPAPANHDSEGEKVQIMTEGSSDVIEANKAAACDDTAKAKDSDKEEATEKSMAAIEKTSTESLKAAIEMGKDWWMKPINDIEFTREEFEKVKAAQAAIERKREMNWEIEAGPCVITREDYERAKAEKAAKKEAPCDLQCAVSFCKDIFVEKSVLYGRSFDEMHPETVTDQLFMKATILKKQLTDRDKSQRLGFAFFEGIRDEFAAVVNYGIIALRQSVFSKTKREFEAPDDLMQFYLEQTRAALSLICDKSADYGHLWRSQRIGTFADMIYTKVLRVKRIENQYRVGGMTEEGYHKFAGDQYRDLINYGLFGVVRMTEIADVMAFEMEEDETDEEEGYE